MDTAVRMSGTLSYLLAVVVSLASGTLLLLKSRNGDVPRRAALAAYISALWAGVLAGQDDVGSHSGWVSMLLEGLRYTTLLAVLRELTPSAVPLWVRRLSLTVCLASVAYAIAGWLGQYYGLYSLPLGNVLVIAGLLLAFVGLVHTEQVVRMTPGTLSAALRTCLAGLGGLFAYDLFLYSQAQLLGELDGDAWALRGLLAAVMLVPFTWGIWNMPKSDVR